MEVSKKDFSQIEIIFSKLNTENKIKVSESLASGLLSHRDVCGVHAGLNVCLLSFPSKAFIAFDKLQKDVTVPQSVLGAK